MMVFRYARAERRVSFFYNRFVRGDKIARQTNRDTPLSQTCSHHGHKAHKVCRRITYQCSFVTFVRGSDFFISAFVLGADGREIEMAFLPRFFARFRLFAAGESQ